MDAVNDKVLLVDDDQPFLRVVSAVLAAGGYVVESATTESDALAMADVVQPGVAVISLDSKSGGAEDLIRRLAAQYPEIECIALARPNDLSRLVELYDLRTLYNHRWKPLDEIGDLARDVARAMERRALKRQNSYLLTELRDARDDLRSQAEYMMRFAGAAAASRLIVACGSFASQVEAGEVGRFLAGLAAIGQVADQELRPLDLSDMLSDAIPLLTPSLERRHVRLAMAADRTAVALGCRASLLQVFLHLALNAVDALEDGGTLTVRCEATHGDREGVEFVVGDDGCGIQPDVLPRVFEPFYTTRSYSRHNGLGLWAARNIVRQHDGEITIDTAVGRGTRVAVWLPRHSVARDQDGAKLELLRAA